MNIFAVTAIVIGVGMVLFMLPPIPGLPIYLTGGIVLVSVGREIMGLWGAIVYACIVSLLLKLMACTVQQKIIGENLGENVAVKQLVSITTTRSINPYNHYIIQSLYTNARLGSMHTVGI